MKRAHALPGPQLAKLAGVSLTTWNVHKANGAPVPKGKRDVPAWLERYATWRRENLTPGRGPGKALVGGFTRQESEKWSARRMRALALRQEQILAEEGGELVRREEVIDAIATAITAVKKRLGDARKKLSPRLYQAPSVEWIDEQLGAEFDAILRSFAHGMSDGVEQRRPAPAPVAGPEDPEGLGADGEAEGQ